MGLLLLVRLLVRVCIDNDANALDGAEAPKLLLQVSLISIVAQTRDNQGLEGIASDVRILVRLIKLRCLRHQLLQLLLLLLLLAIACLKPTLGRVIDVGLLVLLQLGKELRDAADGRRIPSHLPNHIINL